MDLDESVAFRAVAGQSNGRTSDADSTESGSAARCENIQALRPRMHALLRVMGAFGKMLPSTRTSGSVEPVERWPSCSVLAVYKYCTKPWTDVRAVACRTDLLN